MEEVGVTEKLSSLAELGYDICRSVLSLDEVERYRNLLDSYVAEEGSPGRRDLLKRIPEIGQLAHDSRLIEFVDGAIGVGGFPVRSLFFDKIESANWPVLWHQDLAIAVSSRSEMDGFGPWSVKDGIPHVQPPASVLSGMITLRIHLDDADETNGALMVVPGSHRLGRMPEKEIHDHVKRGSVEICCVRAGDVMLMRPLLLHSSKRALHPKHRRVIHIEYANHDLPEPLEWHARG